MEDIQHRVIWGRAFTITSILFGLSGPFTAGITSFLGTLIGIAATREKSIGKYWLIAAWVGFSLCVAYIVAVFALAIAWNN